MNRQSPNEQGDGSRAIALIDFNAGEAAQVNAGLDVIGLVSECGACEEPIQRLLGELEIALCGIAVSLKAQIGVIGNSQAPGFPEQGARGDEEKGEENRSEIIHKTPSQGQ